MYISVLGKRYKVVVLPIVTDTEGTPLDGECDAPTKPGKEIRICGKLAGRDLLETLCHEYLHGACWWLTEEFVTEAARDLAAMLWRIGYREPTDWKKHIDANAD